MKSGFVVRAAAAMAAMTAMPGIAFAQGWTPASEILGQPIQVTTNGTTNTLYFDQGGSLRIVTPGGNTVPGAWSAANGQLCLSANGAQECVPYNGPFQAGQPLTLASSCNSTSTWLAQATNQPPGQGQKGERGQ
jgi:hypothetical protein